MGHDPPRTLEPTHLRCHRYFFRLRATYCAHASRTSVAIETPFSAAISSNAASCGELARADGLIEIDPDGSLRVTPIGRLLVRPIAMAFDAYLPDQQKSGTRIFSKTV